MGNLPLSQNPRLNRLTLGTKIHSSWEPWITECGLRSKRAGLLRG